MSPDPSPAYEQLRQRGLALIHQGRLAEALEIFDRAWRLAGRSQDRNLEERAYCNRSAVAIELGETGDAVARLREILVRNESPENCFFAAYHIARIYELAREHKKGRFYARIACDRAGALQQPMWQAWSHNRMGNLLLAESFVDAATEHYEDALMLLEALEKGPSVERAKILDNLGYCRIIDSRVAEGFTLLFRSLRMLRGLGAREAFVSTRLDLSFAYLEIGRYRHARRHALAALEIARDVGQEESVKNALYLLGEAANLAGRVAEARSWFGQLQKFYPDTPFVTDFLLSIDVRKIINLKA